MTAKRQSATHGLQVEREFGYSQAVKVDGAIHVAGQVARDEAGLVRSVEFSENLGQVLANLEGALAQVGGSVAGLIALGVFVNQEQPDWDQIRREHRRALATSNPAVTIVGVSGLNNPKYMVEICAIAAAGEVSEEEGLPTDRENINGPFGPEPVLETHQAVKVGRHVYIAAQPPTDLEGNLDGSEGMAEQFARSLGRVQALVEAAGATMDDVVSSTIYVTRQPAETDLKEFRAVHREMYSGTNRPAATRVQVSSLPVEGALVSVSAVAVLD